MSLFGFQELVHLNENHYSNRWCMNNITMFECMVKVFIISSTQKYTSQIILKSKLFEIPMEDYYLDFYVH